MSKYGYIGIVESDSDYEPSRNVKDRREQKEQLNQAACVNLVEEKTFRIKNEMRIDKLITELEQGDTIVICNLIFLATGIDRLLDRLQAIEDRGLVLEVLNINKNSLATHAKAIREFSKYVSGSKISKGMKANIYKKRNNLNIKHGRAAIKSWHKQREIALARNTGKNTVKELSDKHNVTRQVIYRILNKKEFKGVTESLPWRFELWGFEECKNRVRIHIERADDAAYVRISLQNAVNIEAYTTKKNITRGKVEKDFFAKSDEELEGIFNNAIEREKNKLELNK